MLFMKFTKWSNYLQRYYISHNQDNIFREPFISVHYVDKIAVATTADAVKDAILCCCCCWIKIKPYLFKMINHVSCPATTGLKQEKAIKTWKNDSDTQCFNFSRSETKFNSNEFHSLSFYILDSLLPSRIFLRYWIGAESWRRPTVMLCYVMLLQIHLPDLPNLIKNIWVQLIIKEQQWNKFVVSFNFPWVIITPLLSCRVFHVLKSCWEWRSHCWVILLKLPFLELKKLLSLCTFILKRFKIIDCKEKNTESHFISRAPSNRIGSKTWS